MYVDRRAILPAKTMPASIADGFEPALGMSRDIARTKTRWTNLPSSLSDLTDRNSLSEGNNTIMALS